MVKQALGKQEYPQPLKQEQIQSGQRWQGSKTQQYQSLKKVYKLYKVNKTAIFLS